MSNVAGSSTANPTIEVVKGWDTKRLDEFLKARLGNIGAHINTITEVQQVDGDSFLDLTIVDLERWKIPGGPAKKIERLIKEIQGEQPVAGQGDFPNLDSLKSIVGEIVRNEVSGLDFKMEQGFNKVRRAMEASIYSPGTEVTGTDKGKLVMEKGTHIIFPLDLTTSSKRSGNGRFTNPPNKNADPKEEEIQQYFINECKELEKSPNIKNKLIVVDKHSSPSLGTRKPDFLLIPNGSHSDMLNVVAVGEIKKRGGDNFNNAHIGQAISFGEKVLQLQPRRGFVYVVLTDCIVINIYVVFRVDRVDKDTHSNPTTQFTYQYTTPAFLEHSSAHNAVNTGWKSLVTIMESSPNNLGWIEPSLKFGNETVKLVRFIGVGRTSVVYEGTHNDALVAVKMAKKANYLPCFENENTALNELSDLNSLHIPKILFDSEDAIVMAQVGERISNLRKKDVKDIINTLKEVHALNYVHRDLRKYNLIRDQCGNIIIIDWGFSIKLGENNDFTFAGALECMPDSVLQSIVNEDNIVYGPEVDLICLVRSFYLMLHRHRFAFDKDDNIKSRAQLMLNFWEDCRRSDVWDSIYNAIENSDYDQLIQQLERLF